MKGLKTNVNFINQKRQIAQLFPDFSIQLILMLTLLGWGMLAIQISEISIWGKLADAGPGMVLLANFDVGFLARFFGLTDEFSICVTQSSVWGADDFGKALAMWMAMVLAMMVPGIFSMIYTRSGGLLHAGRSILFVFGFLAAWSVFCSAAVFLQWVLRKASLLDENMVLTSPYLSALLLIGVGIHQLSLVKGRHMKKCGMMKEALVQTGSQQNRLSIIGTGINYGRECIKCCWLLMLTMFVFGLMNIIAMAVLTLFMLIEKSSFNRQSYLKSSGVFFASIGVVSVFI